MHKTRFTTLWRVILAAFIFVGYLTMGFPYIANLNIDGSVLFAFAGILAVAALAVSILHDKDPNADN